MKKRDVWNQVLIIISCIFVVVFFVLTILDLRTGFINNDTRYLVSAVVDLIFLWWNFADLKKYLDIED